MNETTLRTLENWAEVFRIAKEEARDPLLRAYYNGQAVAYMAALRIVKDAA